MKYVVWQKKGENTLYVVSLICWLDCKDADPKPAVGIIPTQNLHQRPLIIEREEFLEKFKRVEIVRTSGGISRVN